MQYKNKGPPKRSEGVLQTGIYIFFANTPSDAVFYASDELFSVAFPFKPPWSFADTPMLPVQRAERS